MEAARDHLVVSSLANDAPSVTDASALIATRQRACFEQRVPAYRRREIAWFLLSDHDWEIDARPLSAVNETVVELPTGRDALVWNRLHNEIQMAWHAHEVNAQREAKEGERSTQSGCMAVGDGSHCRRFEFTQVQSRCRRGCKVQPKPPVQASHR